MFDMRNAAPMVNDLGTRDFSTRALPSTPLRQPQHLPVFYTFTAAGPVGSTFIDFDQVSLTALYGQETFDVAGPFYTHVTPFIQASAAAANNCVIRRVIPSDANDVAHITLSLVIEGDEATDVDLTTMLPPTMDVPRFERNPDGSLGDQMDDGTPVVIDGYKVRWEASATPTLLQPVAPDLPYGPGNRTVDATAGVRTIPVMEFYARYPGARGNLTGVRVWGARKTDLVDFPEDLFETTKNFPYYFQLIRTTSGDTGRVQEVINNFASRLSRFMLEENVRDPISGAVVDIEHTLDEAYIRTNEAYNSNDLAGVHVYRENLTQTLAGLYNTETNITDDTYPELDANGDPVLDTGGNPVMNSWRDDLIKAGEENHYAFNIFTFNNSDGSPYLAIQQDDTQGIALSHATNVFFEGGDDGTMSETELDNAVILDMENYQNGNHIYQDLVQNPESIIYDSGFGDAAKHALCRILSRRKDTVVVLSSFISGGDTMDLQAQYGLGVNLKNTLNLYPESATFGTGVARGMVMMGSGYIIGSNYNKRVPSSYDLFVKAARYMGSAIGEWRNGFSFDHAPGSVITTLRDIDITWVPAAQRTNFWTSGLNYPLTYRVRQAFWPALKTVYDSDTSVLNSFMVIMAISYLNKVAHAAWREFTGAASYTNAQLEERVNDFVTRNVTNKFDGRLIVVPNATVTEEDAQRGYSWTLPTKLYAPNMKTVMTTYIEAFRIEDLDTV